MKTNSAIALTLALSVSLIGTELSAQAKWTKLSPVAKPAARGNMQTATDAINLYVFGGNSSGTVFYNDLWAYRINNWVELTKDGATGSPAKRRWGSACYDYANNQLVVFGGQDVAKANLGDTWVYSAGKWTKKTPAVSPSARRWAVMAYDWAMGRVILFGGYGTANMNDTWAWDGAKWTKLSPKTSPPIKSRGGIVSLKDQKEILMYGGTTTTSTTTPSSQLWKWDGSNWSEIKQTGGPIGGVSPGACYDELREVMVIYGGHSSYPRSDTYEWNGSSWSKRVVVSPGSRSGPAMGYIAALKKTFSFGGYSGALPMKDDTFEYQTDKIADFKTESTGCASSTTIPTLVAHTMPWVDHIFDIEVVAPASSIPLMFIGGSKKSWGVIPLPLSLAFLGNAKCNLLTSADFRLAARSLKLPIPNLSALIGNDLYLQGLVFDSSLKLSATNLGVMTIGAK